MSRTGHVLVVLTVIFSCFTPILIFTPSPAQAYTPHDPISINGDADFATQAASEGWPGDGTEGDPFIIQDLEINASSRTGIRIMRTTLYFIIRNCFIRDGNSNYFGISFYNLTNGEVNNCILSNSKYGIRLGTSTSTCIENCSFSSNNEIDIRIESCYNITLRNNKLNSNGIDILGNTKEHLSSHEIDDTNTRDNKPILYWNNRIGGEIQSSMGQVIIANCTNIEIKNQRIDGAYIAVELAYSSNCTVSDSTVESCDKYGIDLFRSNNNTIQDNTIIGNHIGMLVEWSEDSYIVNNYVKLNRKYGIYLSYSNNNNLTGNNVTENKNDDIYWYSGRGICMESSKLNKLWDNRLSSNGDFNIELDSSDNNQIYDNIILFKNSDSVYKYGITLSRSTNNLIRNNTLLNCEKGIRCVLSSNNNTIIDNTLMDCEDGIDLRQESENNYISDNVIDNNYRGFILGDTVNLTLINNTMTSGGILIYGDLLENWDTHTIEPSNTVNGKPIYYLKNQVGGAVPPGYSQIILANCSDIRVDNYTFSDVIIGCRIGFCSNITIANSTFTNTERGIYILSSDNITIVDNVLSSIYWYGIYFQYSEHNTISRNNLTDVEEAITVDDSINSTISHNQVTSNEVSAIRVYGGNNNIVAQNCLFQNIVGISIRFSNNNTIAGNNASLNEIGINLFSSNNNSVSVNHVISNSDSGIYLDRSNGNNISHNQANYNGHGIELDESDENNVTENTAIFNGDNGIHIYWSDNNSILCNDIISNNESGINLRSSDDNNVTENNVLSNVQSGIHALTSDRNSIFRNNVKRNGEGILMQTSEENNILWNDITENNRGLVLNDSSFNNILFNNIESNRETGIYIDSSNDNMLHHNDIIDNPRQLYQTAAFTNIWDDGNGEGNFWSDYEGYDNDEDGIGDTRLPHQGVDYHPLTNRERDILSDPWLYILFVPLAIFVLFVLFVVIIGRKRKKKVEKYNEKEAEGLPKTEIQNLPNDSPKRRASPPPDLPDNKS